MVISNFKRSNARPLSKVIQQMKLKITILKSLIAYNSTHSLYPPPSKSVIRTFQKVRFLKPKHKTCVHLTNGILGGFRNFSKKKNSHFNSSCMTFRRFVKPLERANC